jgi:hypothetical protein
MDSDNVKKAGELLERLLGKQAAGEARSYHSFFSRWDELVGPELSGHSQPRDIEKGVLIVQTDHPGWLQMFQMSKERILRKIRKEYPELDIKNLRIILGNPVERESGEAQPHSEASSTEAQEHEGERSSRAEGSQEERSPDIDTNSRLHNELEKLRKHIEQRDREDEEGEK